MTRPILAALTAVALTALAVLGITAPPVRAASDQGQCKQWGMGIIGAETAWGAATGKGITIAIVDTGIELHHEDLAAHIDMVNGHNFVDPTAPPQDDHGHGTHVAGIAAAITNNGRGVVGVAPDATIMPVKVLDSNGTGSTTNVAAGIRWAADHGAQVVNLSLGQDVKGVPVPDANIFDAVEYAWNQHQVISVIAAGNKAFSVSSYATIDAIIVTATTRTDTAASYDNGLSGAKWAMAAPGGAADVTDATGAGDILSTYWDKDHPTATDLYAYEAGTSMATPHVAGAAAVLRSLGLSAQETVDRLLSTAKDLGPKGTDATYGSGRLDVAAAVKRTRTPTRCDAPPSTTTTKARVVATSPSRNTVTTVGSTGTTAPTAPAVTVREPDATVPGAPGPTEQATGGAIHVVTATGRHGRPRPWLASATALVLLAVVGARAGIAARAARSRT